MNNTYGIEFINNNKVYTPDFTIGERIGRGGFGSIYKVTGDFKTPAVIKIGDEQLINEYQMYNTLAKIIPKNIPKCYQFGECRVKMMLQYFIIIEYIDYQLCDDENTFAKQFNDPVPIYMNIYNEVVDILNVMHQHGYIHRDIKPSNILIKQVNGVYIPILIDFGLIDTVINITGEQPYYVGTRCYSSIYQHYGTNITPIDDYINLCYTWMKVLSTITKSNRLPWDTTVIRQDKKKHEFYAYEKWLYQQQYDKNNFFDKVLAYLYSLQHFWTTIINLKAIYYIDPLQKYSFDIHTITTPKHWDKFIKQESLTIAKTPFLNPQLKSIARVDDVISFCKQRMNYTSKVNITDYSLTFMHYMIRQYTTLVNYMWNGLKDITGTFMNVCPSDTKTYLYDWLNNIQLSINKEIKVFDSTMSSVNSYTISDIFAFFNYKRLQNILESAITKLPRVKDLYSQSFAGDYSTFNANLTKLYKRMY